MRNIILICFLLSSCSSASLLESSVSSERYIIVGRLNVQDTTIKCRFNTIGLNSSINVSPDGKSYFVYSIPVDSLTITSISKISIGKRWMVRGLKKNCVNYIGDIAITIAPTRKIVHLSGVYYGIPEHGKPELGPGSDYHNWYNDGCYNPSWEDVLRQGYYMSKPKKLEDNDIVKFEITDNLKEATGYFKAKAKKELIFNKVLVAPEK